MTYFDDVNAMSASKKQALDEILKKYRCQLSSSSYSEMIVDYEDVYTVLNELTQLGIAVRGVAWWCHCTEEHQEMLFCPHGIGGPENEHGPGWFSEMIDFPIYLESEENLRVLNESDNYAAHIPIQNEKIATYLDEFPENEQFIMCLTPAIILFIPDDWEIETYA